MSEHPESSPPSTLILHKERRQAWGMAQTSVCHVVYPRSARDVLEAFQLAASRGWRVHPWGNGRSYGDAALNEGNLLLDFRGMNRVISFDEATGELTAEPGITLGELERFALPKGFWPPVVSGTMHTTLGGCVAANVHGKNNYKYGPWGDHVIRFTLVTPDGAVREVSRTEDPELFHLAIGGFGLLGCFVSITVQLRPVQAGRLEVRSALADDLDGMFDHFERLTEAGSDYMVGWIDAFARGRALGRGQIHSARYLGEGEDLEGRAWMTPESQTLPDRFFWVVPKAWLWRLARPFSFRLGMRLINLARYTLMRLTHTEEPHLQSHARFNHLLDFVPDWKRFYGPTGLIQYQLFLPRDRAREVIRHALKLSQQAGLESWLVVMKRHRADDFPLSHAVDGYSFAMDFPVRPQNRAALLELTGRFEQMALESGGRFYFAKDSVLSARAWERSVGPEAVQRLLAMKAKVDPHDLLGGNLYRRVIAPLKAEGAAPDPEEPPARDEVTEPAEALPAGADRG